MLIESHNLRVSELSESRHELLQPNKCIKHLLLRGKIPHPPLNHNVIVVVMFPTPGVVVLACFSSDISNGLQ